MAIEVSESAMPLVVQEYAAFINRVRKDLGMGPLDLSDFSVDDAGRVIFRVAVEPEPFQSWSCDGVLLNPDLRPS